MVSVQTAAHRLLLALDVPQERHRSKNVQRRRGKFIAGPNARGGLGSKSHVYVEGGVENSRRDDRSQGETSPHRDGCSKAVAG